MKNQQANDSIQANESISTKEYQSTQQPVTQQNNNQELAQQHSETQQIPDHFYDSDIASVCEKDFMSDSEPPKDTIQQRKLLYKEKFLHVFKTIVRIGQGIDKPARYDLISLKHQQVAQSKIVKNIRKKVQPTQELTTSEEVKGYVEKSQGQNVEGKGQNVKIQGQSAVIKVQQQVRAVSLPQYYRTSYLDQSILQKYNLGTINQQIQRLVTSMKRGQTAVFELQHLQTSKKSNIKIKKQTQVHVIRTFDWTTVIDLQGDRKYLKYVIRRGQGAFRISYYDQLTFKYNIYKNNILLNQTNFNMAQMSKEFIKDQLKSNIIWRVMTSMKHLQKIQLLVKDQDFQSNQNPQFYNQLNQNYNTIIVQNPLPEVQQKITQQGSLLQKQRQWKIQIQIIETIKVDDIYLDGRILKKTLTKGVSTAKPQSSSLVYYALRFINQNKQVLKSDQCFQSNWWEDFVHLDNLKGIRKNYLDDYQISRMLKTAIKRMKPAEIAQIQCTDSTMFQFGSDYNQLKQLIQFGQVPSKIRLIVRVYNFTQAKTAFNMQIPQKIIQSRRKKALAIKLLQTGKINKALKRFQNIVAFYSSQKINQEAYDEKVSALMNSILCHMKLKNHIQVIKLCNQILQKPRHGHEVQNLKIQGPGYNTQAKQEAHVEQPQNQQQQTGYKKVKDTRRHAQDLLQNQKIVDKCLYRKAFALVQTGECQLALKSIDKISLEFTNNQDVIKLKQQAAKGVEKYQNKSKKMFQNMFG